MIFQDSLSALNPVFTVGDQIARQFQVHRGVSKEGRNALAKTVDQWSARIPGAKASRTRTSSRWHAPALSWIAMAISLDPKVLDRR